MMSKAPVKSGRLLGSIQKQAEGLSGSVGPTVPYAVYVEYGTSPHEIRPVFSSVLAFEVAGKMVFTTVVHHPGTRAQPFIRETVEDVKEKIPELWQKVFEEATQG
jgi:HK97 gp10 family phage protein